MYGKLSGAFEVKKLPRTGNDYFELKVIIRGNEASDNSRTHSNYPFCVKGRPERDYETVGR